MKRWRVISIGPTDITLHPALLVCVIYTWITGYLTFLLLAMASIIVHEAAHAVVSTLFGQRPESIEITPLGAVMHLEDENKLSCLKRGIMLLAGPASTLLLCYLAILATQRGILSRSLGSMLFLCNLSILMLNMLPVLPLDGGRMLALILGIKLPQQIVGRIMRWIGMCTGIALILLNIVTSWRLGGWNLSLAITGCCIIYCSAKSATTRAMEELRYFLDRKIALERKRSCKTEWYTILHTATLRQVIRLLPPGRFAIYHCVETGSMKSMGWLTEHAVIQCYMNEPSMTLSEALKWTKNKETC